MFDSIANPVLPLLSSYLVYGRSAPEFLPNPPSVLVPTISMAPLMDCDESRTSPPPRQRRHFAIIPAKIHDARRLVDIEFHAFETNQVNQILSYRDYKKATHFERSVHMYEAAMSEPAERRPKTERMRADSKVDDACQAELGVSFRKVVDAQTQEIVSFAKVEMKQYTVAELLTPADVGHDGEPRMNRDWFALNERLRREYVGLREHCCTFCGINRVFRSLILIDDPRYRYACH